MSGNPYSTPKEKFAIARSALMVPVQDESDAIASAFFHVGLGLYHFDRAHADEGIPDRLAKIDCAMDTDGLFDPDGRGLHRAKAANMTVEDKRTFSRNVDECATWFARAYWKAGS
jgi:hypothetical protein